MTGPTTELVVRGIDAIRRAGIWWGIGIGVLALVTVAFWPSLEGTTALTDLEGSAEGLLEAFGAQDIATPAGYLDGQMYALMLPLLLSGLAIATVTSLTSGDEDAGRLELLCALPVARQSVWLARLVAALVVLCVVAATTAVLVAATLGLFELDDAGVGNVLVATAGCALLAAFHAAVVYAAGGLGASRGAAVGVGVLVLVVGYVLNYLFPLADALADAQWLSPWYWAIGEQPVSDGISVAWLALLVAVTAALVALGTVAVERRDIRSA